MPLTECQSRLDGFTPRSFVDPRNAADAVPHFGRPGGVLPRIAEP